MIAAMIGTGASVQKPFIYVKSTKKYTEGNFRLALSKLQLPLIVDSVSQIKYKNQQEVGTIDKFMQESN